MLGSNKETLTTLFFHLRTAINPVKFIKLQMTIMPTKFQPLTPSRSLNSKLLILMNLDHWFYLEDAREGEEDRLWGRRDSLSSVCSRVRSDGSFSCVVKHKDDGHTKFINPNSQRQDKMIKYWVSIGSIHREQGWL